MAAPESGKGNNNGTTRMVTLISSDDVIFEVEEAAASLLRTVHRMMIEGGGGGDDITLPNMDGATLSKVIEYCINHAAPADGAAVDSWVLGIFDMEFLNVDQSMLFSLMTAAHHLDVKGLPEGGQHEANGLSISGASSGSPTPRHAGRADGDGRRS
ncbi:hypothetical protein PR202_ga14708 [Eleusine coracana subsp. coracana]|uniref:SKP1 component POZ domain-containing protein n=1 Tax=Eleusine coracana subsp. coracana TaxID=191504 RepID=A0AAV5CI84_ELECO|nr:hypothetical protein QOZ80_6BG0500990 [Eleusine coracana subsp. coracana]GJM97756.1 hypothetical protein PR202_ga14708 [Eleusine coracana subsp. coracana]